MQSKDDSLFYCNINKNDNNKELIEKLEIYSEKNAKQVYIIDKALGTENQYSYDVSDIAIVMIPKHRIYVVNYGKHISNLEDFVLDLKEDIGHISDKYEYSKILGRSRKWNEELFGFGDIDKFNIDDYIKQEVSQENIRKIDLLISLFIGSINSIDKIGIDEPRTLLDKVKRKIVLFDGQQSRFIYGVPKHKRVTIQGLAGTGKTELLLNKLKEIYTKNDNSVIAFTCYNKVLACELKDRRIPQFFNFMKVSEQIEWNSRLHVFSSWGLKNQPETGMISFICNKYGTTFKAYREIKDFEKLCKEIRLELEKQTSFTPCFDYVFVDESQDFGEEFLLLCEKVANRNIYIAGDIFQNIFDSPGSSKDIPIDYLLNKCYRTDPKTLMFAHAVGMGLYETPKINWLTDEDWIKCGYTFKRDNNVIKLSRKPLRRFEDLDVKETIKLIPSSEEKMVDSVIDQIETIRLENENVGAEDIAIIILDPDYNSMCNYANSISFRLEFDFGWDSTRGDIVKKTEKDSVYISNINNIKGLEFPFLICLLPTKILNNIHSRNGIYTSLTRSFLTSYFIINEKNEKFLSIYKEALKQIKNGIMEITEPSETEKKQIVTNLQEAIKRERMTIEEITEIIVSEYEDKDVGRDIIEVNAKKLYTKCKSDGEILERLRKICDQMI